MDKTKNIFYKRLCKLIYYSATAVSAELNSCNSTSPLSGAVLSTSVSKLLSPESVVDSSVQETNMVDAKNRLKNNTFIIDVFIIRTIPDRAKNKIRTYCAILKIAIPPFGNLRT